MAIDADQLRELITATLQAIDLYSPDAVELLMFTASPESLLGTYLVQLGGGPATGLFGAELSTGEDIWNRWIQQPSRRTLAMRICKIFDTDCVPSELPYITLNPQQRQGNLLLQIIEARIRYMYDPKPLPSKDDHWAMGEYWKRVYNTHLGKGRVADAVDKYRKYALGWSLPTRIAMRTIGK